MADEIDLGYMEQFYMALADKTRLRLLNLMRTSEVCVCFFSEILGESQPKIWRPLAYLRRAGLVKARRDGKWMHYSITWPEDEGGRRSMQAMLDWLSEMDDMQIDLEKYEKVCCTPELLVQIARTPMDFLDAKEATNEISVQKEKQQKKTRAGKTAEVIEDVMEGEIVEAIPPGPVRRYQAHNELEEFLL